MFWERGFDDVRVTEVAERCGVSEKTVYNYFPTKESLVLDREEEMATAIRAALGPGAPSRSPTQAALGVLRNELDELRSHWDGLTRYEGLMDRFMDLVDSTPSLRAAQRDMMDRLVQVAAAAMAARAGVSPDDPEPQIAAHAILGLWRVQFQAIRLLSVGATDFEEVYEGVRAEVARAARLIDSGLWAFEVMVQGRGTREQLKVAAEAAQKAGQEVAAALRQARGLWRQVQSQHPDGSEAWPPVGERYPRHGRPWRASSVHSELEEWKRAQRELKQQWAQAKRGQKQALREALSRQPGRRR
jgi:AcrR family transcriptional regulator